MVSSRPFLNAGGLALVDCGFTLLLVVLERLNLFVLVAGLEDGVCSGVFKSPSGVFLRVGRSNDTTRFERRRRQCDTRRIFLRFSLKSIWQRKFAPAVVDATCCFTMPRVRPW